MWSDEVFVLALFDIRGICCAMNAMDFGLHNFQTYVDAEIAQETITAIDDASTFFVEFYFRTFLD